MAKRKEHSDRPSIPIAKAELTRCPRCGSTDREPYYGVVEREITGLDERTGQPYTHTIWRRTRCRGCGQARIDRHRENRAAA